MIPATFFLLGIEFLRSQLGEGVDPVQMFFDIPVCEVMDGTLELLNLSLYHQLLVNKLPFPAGFILVEEANLTVRIPSRMADPFTQIEDLSRHGKA